MALEGIHFDPGRRLSDVRARDLNLIRSAASAPQPVVPETEHAIVELLANINLDNSGSVQLAHYSGGWVLDGSSFTAFNIGPGNGLDGDHVTLFWGGGHATLPFFEGQRPPP